MSEPEQSQDPHLESTGTPISDPRAPYETPHLEPHARFTVLTGESLPVNPP